MTEATPRKPAPQPPPELIRQIREQNVVPFVGAGLSMAAVLPSYPRLLELLLEKGDIKPAKVRVIRDLLGEGDLDLAAGMLRREMGEYPFYEQIRLILEPIDLRLREPFGHKLLGMMGFRRFVTTNYDRLLERFVAPRHEVFTSLDLEAFRLFGQDTRRGFILKLHGDITRPNTIPFGEAALFARYGCDENGRLLAELPEHAREMRDFLSRLFKENTVLFLGSSLSATEGYARLLVDLVRSWKGSLPHRHYAFVQRDEKAGDLRRYLADAMDIQYLEYEPDALHSQVWEFISYLKAGRAESAPQPGEPWAQWYLANERAAYLGDQLERERTATAVGFLTPTLTNAVATASHIATACRRELAARSAGDPQAVEETLGLMLARSANLVDRLRGGGLAVRVLFLESELRRALDPRRPAADLAVAVERYGFLLQLAAETGLAVRVIPELGAEDLKERYEATFALILNPRQGEPTADVTVAFASQATKNYFEIHMLHTNDAEARDRLYQFERFWAAARGERETERLIRELIAPAAAAVAAPP